MLSSTMWCSAAIIFFFICKSSQVQCLDSCESLRNCQQCIRAPSCGWYLQYRTANGSGCFPNDHLDLLETDPSEGYSHSPKPTSYVKKAPNSVISPEEISLNLRLHEPFTFPITFTPKKTWGKRSVELKHNVKEGINVKFFSNCSGQYEDVIETSKCDNVEFGNSVEFVVKVEQVLCSKRQPERIKKIKMYPSPSTAALKLNVYAYCYCPCEMEGRRGNPVPPEKIPGCHGRGGYVCGVCYCNEGYTGNDCEINTTNTVS